MRVVQPLSKSESSPPTRLIAQESSDDVPERRTEALHAPQGFEVYNAGAAIHRLPNELLVEIFRIGQRGYDAPDNRAMQYLPVISSVCRIWRNVALNESSLWANIIYDEGVYVSGPFLRGIEERVASCLLRSRNSGLTIRLVFRDRGPGSTRLRDMIFPHLSRCRSFYLEFIDHHQAAQWLPLPGSLHHLTIFHCHVHYIGTEATPLMLFSETDNGPRLRDLALRMHGIATHSLASSGVNVELLTELQLGGSCLEWRDTIAFLSRCHSLRKLNLAVRPRGLQEASPPFTLPELYCLQAYGLTFAMVMHTPKLQSLTIFRAPPRLPALSFPNLRALRFEEVNVMKPEIETFLKSNPTIEVLQIREPLEELDSVSGGNGIRSATGKEADNAFLPSLKLIQIFNCGRLDLYGSVIEWLFISRPELRFEEGEDGIRGRVGPDLAALISEYPADENYIYWY